MSSQPYALNDKDFLEQFENKTLDPVHFNHIGHLRIAWLYLTEHDLHTAVKRICGGIKGYAESLGDSAKFNLTMTDAMVRIISRRMDLLHNKSWNSFLEENTDLQNDFLAVLHKHYSEKILSSNAARTSIIRPDIKSI